MPVIHLFTFFMYVVSLINCPENEFIVFKGTDDCTTDFMPYLTASFLFVACVITAMCLICSS